MGRRRTLRVIANEARERERLVELEEKRKLSKDESEELHRLLLKRNRDIEGSNAE